jgi:hypothetical protein
LPVVAPVGTVAFIVVAFQLVIVVAVVPLKVSVPVPWVDPKLVPVMVTAAPTAPVVGDRLVMLGALTTVNVLLLLATPLTVTTTPPVLAPVGTVATIELAPQLVIVVAVVPLKVKVLEPCVEPKFVPVMVTEAPTAPVVGDKLVIVGAAKELPERSAHRRLTPIRRHAVCVKIYSSIASILCRCTKTHQGMSRAPENKLVSVEHVVD